MPYSQYVQEELILRDLLARDRTILANERTLMGYTRTALMFLVAGVTFFKLYPDSASARVIFWIFLPLAGVIQGIGIVSFVRMRRILMRIGAAAKKAEDAALRDAGGPPQ